jgi:hypothetical protein
MRTHVGQSNVPFLRGTVDAFAVTTRRLGVTVDPGQGRHAWITHRWMSEGPFVAGGCPKSSLRWT